MTIRNVESRRDIEAVAALAQEIWTEHYTPFIGAAQVAYMLRRFQSAEAICHAMQEERTRYILAADDAGQHLGYAASLLLPEGVIFISKLYVRNEARGTGIGRALLASCIEAYPGAAGLRLTVNKGNTKSIAAYRRMGFHVERAVVTDIGGGFVMDDYIMELSPCGNQIFVTKGNEL